MLNTHEQARGGQLNTIKNVYFYRHTAFLTLGTGVMSFYAYICVCVCVRGLVNERLTLRGLPRARGGRLHWLWPSHPAIKWTRHYVWAKGREHVCVFLSRCLFFSLSLSASLSAFLALFFHPAVSQLTIILFPLAEKLLLAPSLGLSLFIAPCSALPLPPSICLLCLGVVWGTLAKLQTSLGFVLASFDDLSRFTRAACRSQIYIAQMCIICMCVDEASKTLLHFPPSFLRRSFESECFVSGLCHLGSGLLRLASS